MNDEKKLVIRIVLSMATVAAIATWLAGSLGSAILMLVLVLAWTLWLAG